MSINDSDIKKVARLARLSVDENGIDELATGLNKILSLVEQINHADTQGVKPMAHPFTGMTQPLREDKVTENIDRAALQQGAPSVEEGLFLVPKVLDDNA